jgi:hypothetical protein
MGAHAHATRGMSGSRFDKLERPREERKEDASEQSSPGLTIGRFTPEGPSPAREEAAAPSLERFAADGTQGLRTDRHADEEQPFIRCPVCERDWGRFDTRCGQCGEALDTEKAKAFNAALWAKRLAERKAETEGAARRAAENAKQEQKLGDARKAMAVAMAQQVKQSYETEYQADRIDRPRRSWRAGRSLGTVPFLLFCAYLGEGAARWAFIALAVGFGVLDLWLWLRQSG